MTIIPNFFENGSPFLEHPLLTPERTTREIDFVLSLANLNPGGRVLDIGCGPGRHSLEMARRGYRVLGIDPAAAMIAAARTQAADIDPIPQFQQVRAQEFVLAASEEPFDAAICLFTTLGQMDEGGDNRELVGRAFDALRPGGILFVELPQREPYSTNLKTSDRFGVGERTTEVERLYEQQDQIVTEVFNVVTPGENRIYLLRYRIFDRLELRSLLEDAGFDVINEFGGYEAQPLEPDSPMMILVARKPDPTSIR